MQRGAGRQFRLSRSSARACGRTHWLGLSGKALSPSTGAPRGRSHAATSSAVGSAPAGHRCIGRASPPPPPWAPRRSSLFKGAIRPCQRRAGQAGLQGPTPGLIGQTALWEFNLPPPQAGAPAVPGSGAGRRFGAEAPGCLSPRSCAVGRPPQRAQARAGDRGFPKQAGGALAYPPLLWPRRAQPASKQSRPAVQVFVGRA